MLLQAGAQANTAIEEAGGFSCQTFLWLPLSELLRVAEIELQQSKLVRERGRRDMRWWLQAAKQHFRANKAEGEKQIWDVNTNVCTLEKNVMNDLIYKAAIETQRWRTNAWIPRGKGEGRTWETGLDIYTVLYA